MKKNHNKMFVFGLDGATWDVMGPMIKKGELPTFEFLMKNGSSGTLSSIDPPFSPAVWTTISSGKMPDKHGIDFFFSKSTTVKTARIWDILERKGRTIGLYGHLVTWPPRPIQGFIIPDDLLAPDAQTYPPEYLFLRKMVLEAQEGKPRNLYKFGEYFLKFKEFGIHRKHLMRGLYYLIVQKILRYNFLDRYYRQRFLKEQMQSDAFVHLLSRHQCDFSFYYCNLTDSCAHLYWKYMEPWKFHDVSKDEISKYSQVIPGAYKKADQILKKILGHLDESAAVFVVSDHGFQAASINHKGSTFEIRTEFLVRFLEIEEMIHFGNLGSRFFLNAKAPFKDRLEEIIAKITSLRVEADNEQLFKVQRDNKYSNTVHVALKEEKSLKGETVRFQDKSCCYEDLVEETDARISGAHAMEGVFLARGKGIVRDSWIENHYGVADITPTILAYFGLPVAKDMDGSPMFRIFDTESCVKEMVTYVESYDPQIKNGEMGEADAYSPEESIKERLRALGYL